jgi:2-dehydro-3-deoxyphosphogluconate aldolase/(4S)-4-hydroxy-2-oxoglutarate aldolase
MKKLVGHYVVPVLVIEDSSWAKDLGQVLVDAGLPIVEVTLRTPASWDAASAMRSVAGLKLGIGSVTKTSDLQRGNELGIDFAVSAGIRRDLVECAQGLGIDYVPGVATPSEILLGVELGLELLKWFPAESLGGTRALTAISAPFPKMRFVPTGGITEKNANEYLSQSCVSAVGGSWMFPKVSMAAKDLSEIDKAARIAAGITKEAP